MVMAKSTAGQTSPAAPAATVFVVDDDPDMRRALSLLIRSASLAVDSYESAQDFLDHYDPQKPGCLVLDIRMPGISGLELLSGLSSPVELPPVITAHGEIPLATQAIRSGAVDFLQKPFSPPKLLERIHEAIEIDREDRHQHALAGEIQDRMTQLTDRQREIMSFLARGESTKRIAQHLSISPKTVESHRVRILKKMNVDNPTQLSHLVALLDNRRHRPASGR
jgi:FixJ family two-component response regulator